MDIQIDISAGGCLLLALMCMVIPVEWLLAAVIAAVIHEASHLLAVKLCGGTVPSVRIGSNGAVMESTSMESWKKLICVLAGPAGSFAVLIVSAYFPRMAVCALAQGVYNLLPLYPLDGGRALRCAASILFPEVVGNSIIAIVEWMTIVIVCGAGVLGTYALKLGFLPLIAAGLFARKHLPGKIPCKDGFHRVQYCYHIQ